MSAHLDFLAARVEHISRAMSQETFVFKKKHGLDHRMLEAGCGFIAVSPCQFANNYFDFADSNGEMSIVVECFDVDAETVIDLAAWPVDRPTEVSTLLGRASMLGLHNAVNPSSFAFGPIEIASSATEWLRSGCLGIVILDVVRARSVLAEAGPLLVATLEEGRRLKAALTIEPQILVVSEAA